jgi:ABC-2 type transport system ATP-binding protein
MSLTPALPVVCESAICVSELVKRFPHTTALAGVSFELRRGEVLGLLGPNGAGKTTTLHVLLGLVQPTSGSVRLLGADPFEDRETALRQVGFTSPEAMMDWRLTVKENLRVFAGLYGARPGAVERTLELFELAPHARSKFGDLSLGQQMRGARARRSRPAISVLDEPTSSLNPDIADKTRKPAAPAPRARLDPVHLAQHGRGRGGVRLRSSHRAPWWRRARRWRSASACSAARL